MKTSRKATAIFVAFMVLLSVFAGCTESDGDKETVKAGETIQFGSYEQDNNTANGKEPIVWRVLAVENDRALLLADKILDCKQYNTEYENVTWETCTLRVWLNNEFYNAAFISSEKTKILKTVVANEDNPEFGTDGGNNTDDIVFLLSHSEVTNPVYGFNSKSDIEDSARQAQGTDFAKSNGLWEGKGYSYWWRRTPGAEQNYACSVNIDGLVNHFGTIVDNSTLGVRPAIWINL